MARSKGRGRVRFEFEAASALALGRARTRRSRAASYTLPGWLWGVLVLVGVAAVGVLWLTLDARFYISHVDVSGAVRVSSDEIVQASNLQGLHILWARPAEIEQRVLAALPTLENVQVKCRLPAKCAIVVVERQPKMIWDEGGILWWIDAEGVVFPVVGGSEETVGWTVRGPLPRDEKNRLDERVRIALKELWATGKNVAPELEYVPERGLTFIDVRGWRVILGQGSGMARRLQVLERLVASLEARGLSPKFVDVRFADAPYYSLTNDW